MRFSVNAKYWLYIPLYFTGITSIIIIEFVA